MKRILITGGSGFIGTNLISSILLSNEYQILNVDLSRPKNDDHLPLWSKIDITDKNSLSISIKEFNPNYIIHLAARTDLNGETLNDYKQNSIGVSNLIEIANELKEIDRILFASSMYVCRPGYTPNDFDDYNPHTVYGQSKVITEKLIKNSGLVHPWIILRPTSIWGPYFGEPYVNFFKIILDKKYFHLGSRACTKTYGYIENTVAQIMALLNKPIEKIDKGVFYLGDWPPYDISEWANEIADYSGISIPNIPFFLFRIGAWTGDILKLFRIKFPMTSFRLKNMTTNNVIDLNPIKEILPELPITRKEGIKTTVDWILYNHQKNN